MFIDANVYLEFLLKQEKAEKAKTFITKVSNSKGESFISDFNLDSIMIVLYRNSIPVETMEDFLLEVINSSGINVYETTMKDRLEAIKLMQKYSLDYEDALTLQAASATGSKEIVSFDSHFDNIEEIKRIEP